MQIHGPIGGIMAAVKQSEEEKNLRRLVEKAYRSIGIGRNTVYLPNQEEFWFKNYRVPIGARVTFYSSTGSGRKTALPVKNNASIDLGISRNLRISIRVEPRGFSIIRRPVESNRTI